jgi:hypothetical protein
MNDIGLYAELHFVLFITFDKGLNHMLVLYHIITTCQALDLIIDSYP